MSLLQLIGYNLLIVGGILGLRVLYVILRPVGPRGDR